MKTGTKVLFGLSILGNIVFLAILIALQTPYFDFFLISKGVDVIIPRICAEAEREGIETPCLCRMMNSPYGSFCSQETFDFVKNLDAQKSQQSF